MSLLAKVFQQHGNERNARIYREVLRREAEIGGKLFGPIKPEGRREFFCLDRHTWIWHEEWVDEHGVRHVVTTRYDVRPNGVFKAQDNQPYQRLSAAEAMHLFKAVKAYNKAVDAELYGIVA
ncbi:MAG TPA: hypothetical protein VLG11_01670 [Candidatus Saccharimonadales bacterium]|nr:hypothetical protein [Candidatus Saccharimonadales bacterium]